MTILSYKRRENKRVRPPRKGGDAMHEAYILGVGMTPFRRWPDRSVRDLAEAAVRDALADAGIGAAQVHAVAFANAVQGAMEGQFGIRGQIALRDMDFDAVPIVNVENACASASTALNVALMQVRAGAADIALAVGAEKMTHPDTALSMAAFEGSWERAERAAVIDRLVVLGQEMPVPPDVDESARTVFMDVYAAFTRYHMARFGTTQRQLAAVAAKNHGHSVHNPLAQYRRAFTVDEVLAARAIAWPLTLPMCSPISDGAAAAVVVSGAALRRLGGARAVRIRAQALMNGGRRAPDDIARHISRRAALAAYEAAGLGPGDVDVAECHDATAFGEIQQSENLGFFDFGDGGPAAERGDTTLGGRIPFNPSGGLESKGHPIGATGLGQIFELVTQLRGEAGPRQVAGARIALAENGGGLMGVEEAAVSVTLLERA
jgi:acetyl-CoA acetyltransferase